MNKYPLLISEYLLMMTRIRLSIDCSHTIPQKVPVIVVSNHRSFLDASILMKALNRSVRVVCHHYMVKVPILRDFVTLLSCLPLDKPNSKQFQFLAKTNSVLKSQQWVGIFPEGGQPMVNLTPPGKINNFKRGFAHLALSTSVPHLVVLPVVIVSQQEKVVYPFPISWLKHIEPSEPLFRQSGWHPVVIYEQVHVMVGYPYWITSKHRQQYQGKQAKSVVTELTNYCQQEITKLLAQSIS